MMPILKNVYWQFIFILAFFLLKNSWAVPRSHLSNTFVDARSSSRNNSIEVWKRTLAFSISQTKYDGALPTIHAMRSGPLAAVFRATLSTSSSIPCTAKNPKNKCEVALNGFGTIGEVQYTFNNSDKNLRGRSTQAIVACRCLTQDCTRAVLVRPVTIMEHDASGKVKASTKNTLVYQAVDNEFSDCHTELFRVSYRERYSERRNPFNLTESIDVDYSVADEHHGDFWSARGHRGSKLKCLKSDISRLRRVNLSTISDIRPDRVEHQSDNAQASPCIPPEGVQYFRGDKQDEKEMSGEVFDRALSAARHIASQQDCFGVGKRQIAFMNPATSTLITDTELALTCSSAVLGIMWLWSVLLKQLRVAKEPTRLSVFAVGIQMGLSYVLEALPLHTALSNEINGRNWRSLIAFVDATSSEMVKEKLLGKILVMTVVLGEVEYLSTRVGLVAALTGVFDCIALLLGVAIVYGMIQRYRMNSKGHSSEEGLQEVVHVTGMRSVSTVRPKHWKSSFEESKLCSTSDASSESSK